MDELVVRDQNIRIDKNERNSLGVVTVVSVAQNGSRTDNSTISVVD